MKLRHPVLLACMLAVAAPAAASDPTTTGALPTPANRIVGMWSNVATVGPCGDAPGETQRQTIVFSAGGTFFDNPRFPPGGIPNIGGIAGTHQRSLGVGTWSYNPLTSQYTVSNRFDWFVNNVYHGYQTVNRQILLSLDRNLATGPVRTVRYAANGSIVSERCGSAVSSRL